MFTEEQAAAQLTEEKNVSKTDIDDDEDDDPEESSEYIDEGNLFFSYI